MINKESSVRWWGCGEMDRRGTDITNADKESLPLAGHRTAGISVSFSLSLLFFFFFKIKRLFCYFYNLNKFCILKASSILLGLVVWKLKKKTKQKHPKPKTFPNNPAFYFKNKEHDFLSFFFSFLSCISLEQKQASFLSEWAFQRLGLPMPLRYYVCECLRSLCVSKIHKNRSAAALYNKRRIQCLILAVP